MLSDNIKDTIRQAYKNIGQELENFTPRKQQTFLIAEIAKTLAGEYDKSRKIITIEAGTGTGKSLAYALGSIPLAKARKKKVCIATATVALQEQLVDKDLPFLKKFGGVDFSFTLVKGRQRYVCAQKLSQAVSDDDNPQVGFTFAERPSLSDLNNLKAMHKALKDNSWQGDIDSWKEPIAPQLWHQIQSDKHSCLKHLSEHTHCPFHKARETTELSDVLVINHSLLLADLSLGGGKILPDPEECFFVIDEAHHLPKVARDHASASVTVKGALDWAAKLQETSDKMARLIKSQSAISPSLKIADDAQDLIVELTKVKGFIETNAAVYFDKEALYRFENGLIPSTLKHWAADISDISKKLISQTIKLYNLLMDAVKENEVQLYLAEPLLGESGFMINRLENLQALWQMYAHTDSEKGAPLARWIEKTEGKKQDYVLSASPLEVGFTLEDGLWSKCEGAVLCSATVRALNSFDHFRIQAGLSKNDGSQYQFVASPFDYQSNATLVIPTMKCEPSSDKFPEEVIEKLPALMPENEASLVLFSSYWQMERTAEALRKKGHKILVQGEQSRQSIIKRHKVLCDKNATSIVFGTQSFSEGLDLPGKYLTNLVIAKLPFSVPTSPVEEAHAEHITNKGGNPFMQIAVPETSKKLIQACGRLLRNEKDTGTISILDRRLVSKRYGQDLLNSLPPFKRKVEY
ncbi:ATP-dependent DNA helicase DinG [Thalassotalea atypica]|uniref:ATP-dependent DNA helicase DinG n=1 Tax=Thalassotalea atypica TaxID=2054316 RepID=UPI0025735EAB|nr:ATP-dependent DNA helicase DinG [Thalassotalea atypica]